MMERKPRAPVSALDGPAGDRVQRLFVEAKLHAFHLEHALILLGQRVFRPRQDFDQGALVEIVQASRESADGR